MLKESLGKTRLSFLTKIRPKGILLKGYYNYLLRNFEVP